MMLESGTGDLLLLGQEAAHQALTPPPIRHFAETRPQGFKVLCL